MTSPKAPTTLRQPIKVKDAFVYRVNGIEIQLPSLSYLKPGLVRQLRNRSDVDAMYTLLELCLPAEALDIVDDMDPDEFQGLVDAWREHSGLRLGES